MDEGGAGLAASDPMTGNKKGASSSSSSQNDYYDRPEEKLWKQCAPPCTEQFCTDNPREVCSAKNIFT